MAKKIAIILGVVIVVLLGILVFYNPAPKPSNSGSEMALMMSPDNHVMVNAPEPNTAIASPVSISGTVTGGGWFFEGTFPVEVLDANGTVLGQGQAQAKPTSTWTSTGTVNFVATISFKQPQTATGSIMFAKDNPSGAVANAESFNIPVMFSAGTAQ